MEYLREYLKKSAKFEVLKEDKNFGDHFFGKFLSLESDGYLISKIFCKDVELLFEINQEIELLIHTPMGVYSLVCAVLEKLDDGWKISQPATVRHSQKREFLRADIEADINLTITDENGEIKTFKGKTIDICAGGVSLDLDFNIDDYSDIDIELLLDDKVIISEGELAYCRPQAKDGNLLFHTALIMTDLSKENIEFISQKCLEYVNKP